MKYETEKQLIKLKTNDNTSDNNGVSLLAGKIMIMTAAADIRYAKKELQNSCTYTNKAIFTNTMHLQCSRRVTIDVFTLKPGYKKNCCVTIFFCWHKHICTQVLMWFGDLITIYVQRYIVSSFASSKASHELFAASNCN